jgi:hypothetical protein
MEIFIPDIYAKNIYEIDFKSLKKRGIKCVIFDLDNTIAPLNMPAPDKDIKDLFADLELLGFKVIILSNASKSRVEPFKEKLNVDSSFYSHKPFKKKYKKILDIYNFKDNEIACIGDQLLTDILGANRMGFLSILVNPVSNIDGLGARFNRIFERMIFKSLDKRGLFKIGEYYE